MPQTNIRLTREWPCAVINCTTHTSFDAKCYSEGHQVGTQWALPINSRCAFRAGQIILIDTSLAPTAYFYHIRLTSAIIVSKWPKTKQTFYLLDRARREGDSESL